MFGSIASKNAKMFKSAKNVLIVFQFSHMTSKSREGTFAYDDIKFSHVNFRLDLFSYRFGWLQPKKLFLWFLRGIIDLKF